MIDEIYPDELCLICGKSQAEAKLRLVGHGRGEPMCDPDCTEPPHWDPRQRIYTEITEQILCQLETEADSCVWHRFPVEVSADVLHSLVRVVRAAMEVDRITDQEIDGEKVRVMGSEAQAALDRMFPTLPKR